MESTRGIPIPAEPAAGVALLGLAVAVVGVALQDTIGATTLLTAAGLALLVGGTTYALAAGSAVQRVALAVCALVAVQLLWFGGVLGWLGAVGCAAVLAGVAVSIRRARP